MATKLTGMLNLSKIDRSLVFTTRNGDKAIWIDIVPNKNGADEYGNTHAVTLYDKENRQTIYLGNLKEVEFGSAKPAEPAPQNEEDQDLPF